MDEQRQTSTTEEPVGIVISGGARGDVTPRFAAYEWCEVPELPARAPARRAA